MTVTVGFLLAEKPSEDSVLPHVVEHLHRAGAEASTWVCRADEPIPPALRGAGAVALRDVSPLGLSVAGRLEDAGIHCCNSVAATALASRKDAVATVLAGLGVRVPPSVVVPTWEEARRASADRPVVAKALAGRGGTGVVLGDDRGLPERAPFPGPYLVQERLAHAGPDRKVFVVGPRVWGVLRPWPAVRLAEKLGRPFTPAAQEVGVTLEVGVALGLEVYGVDLVPTDDGPVVVDVNAFPGFKGVAGAAEALAAHLLALAGVGARS